LVNLSFPEVNSINPDDVPNISEIKGSKAINYLLNRGNPGFGVDIGFKYRFTPDLTFSVSAIDLGKINWNTNLNSKVFSVEYQLPDNSFTNTSTIGEVNTITKTIENYSYSDSIADIFHSTYERTAFSRSMPLTFYAGIKYQFDPNFSISLIDRYLMIKNMNYNSFSIAVKYDIHKNISLSTGYSMIGDSYINIPFALLFRQKYGQIYLGTDNLVSVLAPSFTNFAGVSFGACFYLFTKRDLSLNSSYYLPFYKPRKIKKNQKNGQILKEYPEY
jgi:hypothetical protein